jgi:hypothetical protein
MAKRPVLQYRFDRIEGNLPKSGWNKVRAAYRVSVGGKHVGTVFDIYVTHLEQSAWEANGFDGHRGVHQHQWQAALALSWDPTVEADQSPYKAARRREVEIV